MNIGIVPDPLNHPDWQAIKAFLEPAAIRGGMPVYRDTWAVWAVYDGGLTGAATAHLAEGGWGEVVLVGGVNARRWIKELDDRIAAWLRDEGMSTVRAFGRKGWARLLKGWRVVGQVNGLTVFERSI